VTGAADLVTAEPVGQRVLMTADAVGGVWRYALDLARELGAAGGAVLLATMGPRPDRDQLGEAERVPGLALVSSDFRLEWMDDPWSDVDRAAHWLLELARAWRPDIVHLNGFCHGALSWPAPVVVAGHSCVASWWQAVQGEEAPASWAEYRRRVRAGLAAADLVTAPTAAMLAALERHYGPLPRARVIPNGARPTDYRVAEKEPFALSVGRLWDEAKNVEALAAIAADLPWPVRLVGATARPEGGRDGGRAGGLAGALGGVDLLGPLPHADLADLMARAAVYVHPARYEPFGLSPLEAALSGCALVLADIPSLREIWGDAARYAPPDDPAALRQVLVQVMDDAAERRALAERALVRGRRLTAWRTAHAYARAYRELATEGVRA
jgi:glycogen synthase